MDAKIYSVDEVSFGYTASEPPAMVVVARGRVPTSGWSNGRLAPRVYVSPPSDGIWDFDFIAKAPNGIALQVISVIESEPLVLVPPSWVKGVRIHSSTNEIESGNETNKNPGVTQLHHFASNTQGGIDTFPWKLINMGGPDVFPWLVSPTSGVDLFPWKISTLTIEDSGGESLESLATTEEKIKPELLKHFIGELVGLHIRTFTEGDAITEDFRHNRVNFVLSKGQKTISKIYIG